MTIKAVTLKNPYIDLEIRSSRTANLNKDENGSWKFPRRWSNEVMSGLEKRGPDLNTVLPYSRYTQHRRNGFSGIGSQEAQVTLKVHVCRRSNGFKYWGHKIVHRAQKNRSVDQLGEIASSGSGTKRGKTEIHRNHNYNYNSMSLSSETLHFIVG